MKGDHIRVETLDDAGNVTAANYDGSVCAFAAKPRAFGAPQAALGLDRLAQPSKGASMPQMSIR
jgi:hypothetical protein